MFRYKCTGPSSRRTKGLFQRTNCHCEVVIYRAADKSLARPERKQTTATEVLIFIYPFYNHNWRNISTIYINIYIYITRIASKEIFSLSNKIHREVVWAKELSAPLYKVHRSAATSLLTLIKYKW